MAGDEWILDVEPERLLEGFPEPLREALEGWDAMRIAEFLRRHEGQSLYLPRLDYLARELKRELIREEFSGLNHYALSRRYGVSLAHVYRILAECRTDRSEMQQEDLFS